VTSAEPLQSKSQYSRQFKSWKFRKNIKDDEWKFVQARVQKRKRDGKESNVYVDGVLMPATKMRKEVARHDWRNVYERYNTGRH
jgi:hypothetical protein